jgi:tetratricopeptide (TPR) repeat protein
VLVRRVLARATGKTNAAPTAHFVDQQAHCDVSMWVWLVGISGTAGSASAEQLHLVLPNTRLSIRLSPNHPDVSPPDTAAAMSQESSTFKRWIDMLLPLGGEFGDLRDVSGEEPEAAAWELLGETAVDVLSSRGRPATALLVAIELRRQGWISLSPVEDAAEACEAGLFFVQSADSPLDRERIRQSVSLAHSIRALWEELVGEWMPESVRLQVLCANLELLSRAYGSTGITTRATEQLVDSLDGRFDALAREVSRLLGRRDRSGKPSAREPKEEEERQLQELQKDLEKAITLRLTRGLTLLNKIQSDNNKQIFRPILDELFSASRLDQALIRRVRHLSASELIDRNDLQVRARRAVKITGRARTDTIQIYEEVIQKLQRAIDIRLRLEDGGKEEDRPVAELAADLNHFADWKGLATAPKLFGDLLRGDALICQTRIALPSSSVLAHEEAGTLRLMTLFAAAEPATLVGNPEAIEQIQTTGSLATLISGGPAPSLEMLKAIFERFRRSGRFPEARLWASVAESQDTAAAAFSQQVEAELIQRRGALLLQIEELRRRWPAGSRVEGLPVAIEEQLRAASYQAETGYFDRAEELLHPVAAHIDEEQRQADEVSDRTQREVEARLRTLQNHLGEIASEELRATVSRAVAALELQLRSGSAEIAEIVPILEAAERAPAEVLSRARLEHLFPDLRATEQPPEPRLATLPESPASVLRTESRAVAAGAEPAVRAAPLPGAPPADRWSQKAEVLFASGEQKRYSGFIQGAERDFREALELKPDHLRARSQLASVLTQKHEREEAILVLERGHLLAPRHLPFLNALSNICLSAGRLQAARAYALRGLEITDSPAQEVHLLLQLYQAEKFLGNLPAATSALARLSQLRPQDTQYQQELSRLTGRQTEGEPSPEEALPPEQDEVFPWELAPEPLQISAFLGDDLERDFVIVSEDFVETRAPQEIAETAIDLSHRAISKPNPKRPDEGAEQLRTAAKLLTGLKRRYPEFDYLKHVQTIHPNDFRNYIGTSHEETLRRYLSYYAIFQGNFYALRQRKASARAYYLEHFRVSGQIRSYSLVAAAKLFEASGAESSRLLSSARDKIRMEHSVRERSRRAGQEFVLIFCLALERQGLVPDQPATPLPPRAEDLVRLFIEICHVNEAASWTTLHLIYRPEALVHETFSRLQQAGTLGIEASDPAGWLQLALRTSKESQDRLEESFRHLDELLQVRSYSEAVRVAAGRKQDLAASPGLRLFERFEAMLRTAERFHAALRFEDKRFLALEIRRASEQLQLEIEAEPTELSRLFAGRAVYRLSRNVEADFEEFRARSLPSLDLQILKSSESSRGVIRCDVQIENHGLSPAEEISLWFSAATGTEPLAEIHLDRVIPGQMNEQVRKIDIELPGPAPGRAFELLAGGTYRDSDGHRHILDEVRMRVDVRYDDFQPIGNPYVAGGIVKNPEVFKGRGALVQEILAEVASPRSTGAVVMYGQKRSGKSSALHWVAESAPPWIVPVQIEFQFLSIVNEHVFPNLLHFMAEAIADEAELKRDLELPRLDYAELLGASSPTMPFRKYMKQVNAALGPDRRLLLLFDEFTDLTGRIANHETARGYMRLLKGMIEHGMFSCVLCGIDSMPKMVKEFSNDFAVANLRYVGYLDLQSTKELIEDPIRLEDGSSRFTSAAVEAILQLTARSPYLCQLICQRLVEYLNEERNPDPTVTRADIDQAVRDMVEGGRLLNPWTTFDGLCRYKENIGQDNRATILEGLVLYTVADEMQRSEFVTLEVIIRRLHGLAGEDEIESTINDLYDRKVLGVPPLSPVRQFQIEVKLYYQWIVRNRPLDAEALVAFGRKLERLNERGAGDGAGRTVVPR